MIAARKQHRTAQYVPMTDSQLLVRGLTLLRGHIRTDRAVCRDDRHMQHKHSVQAADCTRLKLTSVSPYRWLMVRRPDPALLHRDLCCDHTVQQKAPRVAPAELKSLQVLGGPEQQEVLPTQSRTGHRGALLRGLHHLGPQPAHVLGLQDTASTGWGEWKQHMLCRRLMLEQSLPQPDRTGDSAHARLLR